MAPNLNPELLPDHRWGGADRVLGAAQASQMTDTHVVSTLKEKRIQVASQMEGGLERAAGIEPTSSIWNTDALPLS
jgi:hypothetical protein